MSNSSNVDPNPAVGLTGPPLTFICRDLSVIQPVTRPEIIAAWQDATFAKSNHRIVAIDSSTVPTDMQDEVLPVLIETGTWTSRYYESRKGYRWSYLPIRTTEEWRDSVSDENATQLEQNEWREIGRYMQQTEDEGSKGLERAWWTTVRGILELGDATVGDTYLETLPEPQWDGSEVDQAYRTQGERYPMPYDHGVIVACPNFAKDRLPRGESQSFDVQRDRFRQGRPDDRQTSTTEISGAEEAGDEVEEAAWILTNMV